MPRDTVLPPSPRPPDLLGVQSPLEDERATYDEVPKMFHDWGGTGHRRPVRRRRVPARSRPGLRLPRCARDAPRRLRLHGTSATAYGAECFELEATNHLNNFESFPTGECTNERHTPVIGGRITGLSNLA